MGLQMKSRIKGKFTFQTAGVLFVLSALLELFSINSRVPLFGNIQGGMIAATYHLIYVVLFFPLGFGLYKAKSWAYTLVFVAPKGPGDLPGDVTGQIRGNRWNP